MRKRIWELDFARGIALVGMILIHLIYDLTELFGIISWQAPDWYQIFQNNYGLLFLLISGVSATLGSRCVRRGLLVFCCGLPVTAATVLLWKIGLAGKEILIYFGVLHCIGCCMLLWAIFRRLPDRLLPVLGLLFVAAGLYLRHYWFNTGWLLIPIGVTPGWFASSDYFPLLPNFGYFLLGAYLGRRLYPEKTSRFPNSEPRGRVSRMLCCMGERSLLIYLLHQPLLAILLFPLSLC